jgi:acyl-CoA thioester hydrolase
MSTPAPATDLPLDLYRGSVNAWECDENLHMNVRFFASRAMEGLAFLAAAIGMPRAFQEKASSTLLVRDMHVRFLKEAHQGAALSMKGGVVAIDDTTMRTYLELRHASGAPAATFNMTLAHVEPHDQTPFPWSARVRESAQRYLCTAPAHGSPRSVAIDVAPSAPTREDAEALKAPIVGLLAVPPDHCDAFGFMRMELFLGRVSDAVPNLMAQWREETGRAAGATQTGGAVLEYRLCPSRWPRAGDLLEVRSGIVEVGEKTNRIAHWLFDPVSGDAWCTAEAVAVTFDLVTRKTIPIPDAQRAALQAKLVPGMKI